MDICLKLNYLKSEWIFQKSTAFHMCNIDEWFNNIQIFEFYLTSFYGLTVKTSALLEKETSFKKTRSEGWSIHRWDTLLSGFSSLPNSFDSLTFKYLSLIWLRVRESTSCHAWQKKTVRGDLLWWIKIRVCQIKMQSAQNAINTWLLIDRLH